MSFVKYKELYKPQNTIYELQRKENSTLQTSIAFHPGAESKLLTDVRMQSWAGF